VVTRNSSVPGHEIRYFCIALLLLYSRICIFIYPKYISDFWVQLLPQECETYICQYSVILTRKYRTGAGKMTYIAMEFIEKKKRNIKFNRPYSKVKKKNQQGQKWQLFFHFRFSVIILSLLLQQ
jgi:hypothetical protein